jgi:hypothetical protein
MLAGLGMKLIFDFPEGNKERNKLEASGYVPGEHIVASFDLSEAEEGEFEEEEVGILEY